MAVPRVKHGRPVQRLLCASCSSLNAPSAKFCSGCGSKLAAGGASARSPTPQGGDASTNDIEPAKAVGLMPCQKPKQAVSPRELRPSEWRSGLHRYSSDNSLAPISADGLLQRLESALHSGEAFLLCSAIIATNKWLSEQGLTHGALPTAESRELAVEHATSTLWTSRHKSLYVTACQKYSAALAERDQQDFEEEPAVAVDQPVPAPAPAPEPEIPVILRQLTPPHRKEAKPSMPEMPLDQLLDSAIKSNNEAYLRDVIAKAHRISYSSEKLSEAEAFLADRFEARLKLHYKNKIRAMQIPLAATLADLRQQLHRLYFNGDPRKIRQLDIHYKDSDGDLIWLDSEQDWQLCWAERRRCPEGNDGNRLTLWLCDANSAESALLRSTTVAKPRGLPAEPQAVAQPQALQPAPQLVQPRRSVASQLSDQLKIPVPVLTRDWREPSAPSFAVVQQHLAPPAPAAKASAPPPAPTIQPSKKEKHRDQFGRTVRFNEATEVEYAYSPQPASPMVQPTPLASESGSLELHTVRAMDTTLNASAAPLKLASQWASFGQTESQELNLHTVRMMDSTRTTAHQQQTGTSASWGEPPWGPQSEAQLGGGGGGLELHTVRAMDTLRQTQLQTPPEMQQARPAPSEAMSDSLHLRTVKPDPLDSTFANAVMPLIKAGATVDNGVIVVNGKFMGNDRLGRTVMRPSEGPFPSNSGSAFMDKTLGSALADKAAHRPVPGEIVNPITCPRPTKRTYGR